MNNNQYEKQKPVDVFPIYYDYNVGFDMRFRQYNAIRSFFEHEATSKEIAAQIMFSVTVRSFDQVYTFALPQSVEFIKTLAESAVEILMKLGIDYIDSQKIMDELDKRCNIFDVFDEVIVAKKQIEALEQGLEQNSNESGNYWVGGGFGITGAIKGAIKAEIMNVGTEALIGLGKMITGNTDSDKINKAKNQLFESRPLVNCCTNGINHMCSEMFFIIYKIITDNGIMPPMTFEEEKAVGKYKNIVTMYEKRKCNKHQAIESLCQCIELYPYHLWFPAYIYKIAEASEDNLIKLTKYLGINMDFLHWRGAIDRNPDIYPGFD